MPPEKRGTSELDAYNRTLKSKDKAPQNISTPLIMVVVIKIAVMIDNNGKNFYYGQ